MSRKIQETCQDILNQLAVPSPHISRPAPRFSKRSNPSRHIWAPPLEFPPIPSLAAQLVPLGCSVEESPEVESAFVSLVKDLQSTYERDYEKLLWRLSKHSSSTKLHYLAQRIHHLLEARYTQKIAFWQEAILQTASVIVQEHSKQTASTYVRPFFKPEWTPFLKGFFAQNAYPTHQDKVLLATKTGMTVKQIYDWFQNHRTREKRKGVPLKRSDNQGSLDFSSEDSSPSRVNVMADDNVPPHKKRRIATDESLAPFRAPSVSTQIFDFFGLPSDAVWPRSYIEKEIKTFWQYPVKGEWRPDLGSFIWPRGSPPHSRSIKRRALDSNVDEQIAESFASKLHLLLSPCKHRSSDTQKHTEEISDTFELWSHRRLYPNQHPAFVEYRQSTEPSKHGPPSHPIKPLPKNRRRPNCLPLSCGRASSSSLSSPRPISPSTSSSVISSPPSLVRYSSCSSLDTRFTPEFSPPHSSQLLGISSVKGFEAYAEPVLGLNMLVPS